MVLSKRSTVSRFPYLQNVGTDYTNLIKWANGCEAHRSVSGHNESSIKVKDQLLLVICGPALATSLPPPTPPPTLGPFSCTSGWSQPPFPPSWALSLQGQWRGGGAGDLDSKISWLISSSEETPHSNAFPGKKDVAFHFRKKKKHTPKQKLLSSPRHREQQEWIFNC